MVGIDQFLANSPYSAPVDLKKLRFIYQAIEQHVTSKNVSVKDLRILEVACGNGGITLPLASLGCTVRAFDIDIEEVLLIERGASKKGFTNLTVTVDDAYTFQDGNLYDIVIMAEVIYALPDLDRLLSNISSLMHDGACLIVTMPNGYGPWQIKRHLDPFTYLRKSNFLRKVMGKPSYKFSSDADSAHYFTKKQVLKLFHSYSQHFLSMRNSDSILGPFGTLRNSPYAGSLDIKLADLLPHWASSGWYFSFQKNSNGQ